MDSPNDTPLDPEELAHNAHAEGIIQLCLDHYTAARLLFEQALALGEQVFGPTNLFVAAALRDLAMTLQALGDAAAARPLRERVITIYEQIFGPDASEVASSLNELAKLLQDQGDYTAVRPQVLRIWERTLGVNHLNTAVILNNLSVCYAHQGRFTLALPLLERAISIWRKQLGHRHPTTIYAQQSLAELHRCLSIADLPETVRAALQVRDSTALLRALDALPSKQAQAVALHLQKLGILPPPHKPGYRRRPR